MNLFTYKMTHDTGFAPNPYGGFLSLATCKPRIRDVANEGDYIAGFSSVKLNDKDGANRLIFLAKVDEKLTFGEYWDRYPQKRPENAPKNINGYRTGDNIYKPANTENGYEIIDNDSHCNKSMQRDIGGKFVLVCREFYYFGKNNTLDISDCKVDIPSGVGHRHITDTKLIDGLVKLVKRYSSRCRIKGVEI